ncbi:MAG: homocysteine S-methyltransferase family protein [Candidatus Delongbacteria bacterium]|nr:homocysteine S-methyltransferase family protein [Candidatus Delongbacteria bacterium]
MTKLAEFITTGSPCLLDGAMGTQLALAGLEMGGQNCITNPAQVLAIHQQYAGVGCDIHLTNTLTMNRIYLETHAIGVDVAEVNLAAARIARSALLPGQFLLGDIGSTGELLEPYGDQTTEQLYATFKEQAELLYSGAVDGFLIETMIDLREALCALRACRAVTPLPVLVTLSFQTSAAGGRTVMGDSTAEMAVELARAGAAAIGANCSDLDFAETAQILDIMRNQVDLPLIAQPNAGKPRIQDGRLVYDLTPAAFAAGIKLCLTAGATLVGGCCGTTPEHIRHVAELLKADSRPDQRSFV